MRSLQGQLLIASPRLLDPNFFRSVVLMVQHTGHGAMGLVLNRPLDTTIKTAWQQVSKDPCLIDGYLHEGGPCEGPLVVLHTDKALSQIQILPGLHLTTEKRAVQELVSRNYCPMKFLVGYAGWTAGQVESELDEGSWLVTGATSDHIFRDSDDQWYSLFKAIARAAAPRGLKPKFMPEDPSVN